MPDILYLLYTGDGVIQKITPAQWDTMIKVGKVLAIKPGPGM
jgi:hypothetical protein